MISFSLPAAGHVVLAVYDLLGREVATLVKEDLAAGSHAVRFDAGRIASGVYFYRIEAGQYVQSMKMMIVK
jgi:hypothetical protein